MSAMNEPPSPEPPEPPEPPDDGGDNEVRQEREADPGPIETETFLGGEGTLRDDSRRQ